MCVEGDELKKLSIYKRILGQEVRLQRTGFGVGGFLGQVLNADQRIGKRAGCR